MSLTGPTALPGLGHRRDHGVHMSLRPTGPAVTEYWYDGLGPPSRGRGPRLALWIFLAGLGVAFGEAHDLARDPTILVDPDRIAAEHSPGWRSRPASPSPTATGGVRPRVDHSPPSVPARDGRRDP